MEGKTEGRKGRRETERHSKSDGGREVGSCVCGGGVGDKVRERVRKETWKTHAHAQQTQHMAGPSSRPVLQ